MDTAQPHIAGDQPRAAATLAQAARQRRDLVSGADMEEAALLRFVAGPDGGLFDAPAEGWLAVPGSEEEG